MKNLALISISVGRAVYVFHVKTVWTFQVLSDISVQSTKHKHNQQKVQIKNIWRIRVLEWEWLLQAKLQDSQYLQR